MRRIINDCGCWWEYFCVGVGVFVEYDGWCVVDWFGVLLCVNCCGLGVDG